MKSSKSEEIKLEKPFSGWWYLIILVPIIIFNILRFALQDSERIKIPRAIGHADDRGVDILVTKGSKRTVIVKSHLEATAVDPNVPILYRYNGGKGYIGGFEELVPAKKDWARLHYVPKTNLQNIDMISFEIPKDFQTNLTWVRIRSYNYQVLPCCQ